MKNKLKWRSMCINGDGGKSEMSDTDGRIAELERQLDAKNAEITAWKKEVIKWQDTDTENQEAIEAKDADIKSLFDEIKRLKKGFGDITSMLLRGDK